MNRGATQPLSCNPPPVNPLTAKFNIEDMLKKFMSVINARFQEMNARFQGIKASQRNQEVSIRNLENQIGQLAKFISERPLGALPSNTEKNSREHVNAISVTYVQGISCDETIMVFQEKSARGNEGGLFSTIERRAEEKAYH